MIEAPSQQRSSPDSTSGMREALEAAKKHIDLFSAHYRRAASTERLLTQIDTALSEERRADPTTVEKCARIAEPKGKRPCDCDTCYCGNYDDAQLVAGWDVQASIAKAIRSLNSQTTAQKA